MRLMTNSGLGSSVSRAKRAIFGSVLASGIMTGCEISPETSTPRDTRVISIAPTTSTVLFSRTEDGPQSRIDADHFLVFFEPASSSQTREETISALGSLGSRVVGRNDYSHMVEFSYSGVPQLRMFLDRVSSMNGVFAALPDAVVGGMRDPNPNVSGASYHWVDQINARRAWGVTVGSNAVPVAVIDSAIDPISPYFPRNVIFRYGLCQDASLTLNYHEISSGSVSSNCDGFSSADPHGLQVATILSASGEDGIPYLGMAWRNPLYSFDVYGTGSFGIPTQSRINAAIDSAINHGVKVINLSVGPVQGDAIAENFMYYRVGLRNSVLHARDRDVLIVLAAGNQAISDDLLLPFGQRAETYSAFMSNLLIVGGVDFNNCLVRSGSGGSNFGGVVRIYAPGFSFDAPSRSGPLFGTSLAAPLVAGTAALMRSVNTELTSQGVVRILLSSAARSQRGCAEADSLPVLDAAAAVEEAQRVLDPRNISWRNEYPLVYLNGVIDLGNEGSLAYGTVKQGSENQLYLHLIRLSPTGETLWERDVPIRGASASDLSKVIVNLSELASGSFVANGFVIERDASPGVDQVRRNSFIMGITSDGTQIYQTDNTGHDFSQIISQDGSGFISSADSGNLIHQYTLGGRFISERVFDYTNIASSVLLPLMQNRFGSTVRQYAPGGSVGSTSDGRDFYISLRAVTPDSRQFIGTAHYAGSILLDLSSTADARIAAARTPLSFNAIELPRSDYYFAIPQINVLSDNSNIYSYDFDSSAGSNRRFVRISPDGNVLWDRVLPITHRRDVFARLADSSILWQAFDLAASSTQYLKRLNSDGTLLGTEHRLDISPYTGYISSVVSGSTVYLIATRPVGSNYSSLLIRLDQNLEYR